MQNEIMKDDGSLNFSALKGKAPIEVAVDLLQYFTTKKFIKEKLDSISKDNSSIH